MADIKNILTRLDNQNIHMEYIKLKDLHENPLNTTLRFITAKKYEQLKKDLTRDGLLMPLLVYKDDKQKWIVIDGNHRYKAMMELGWGDTEVRCDRLAFGHEDEGYYAIIEGDPQRSRYFHTIDQGILWYSLKRNDPGYALYNKEATMTALEEMGIPFDEVNLLVEEVPTFQEVIDMSLDLGKDVEEDEPPAVDETKTVSKLGEVYQLGRHRLMCGDSTKIEDVTKLMDGKKADMVFTDPPYNVAGESSNYAADVSKSMKSLKDSEWDKNFNVWDAVPLLQSFVNENSTTYIFTSHFLFGELYKAYKDWADFTNYCVWNKPNPMPSLSKRHWTWNTELCLYATKGKHTFNFPDGENALSGWITNKYSDGTHPTQKPIEICVNPITKSSKPNDLIMDLFGGSGSTLIAAEQTNRTCYMMELDPKYCDVIRKRYAKFIGKEEEWEKETPSI